MKFLHHLWRSFGLYLIPLAVLAWLVNSDPDLGASTRDMLQGVAVITLAITFAHLARKYMMPYVKLEKLIDQVMKGNTAAGLTFVGVMILMAALLIVFAQRAHAGELETYIPAGAQKYGPVLKTEQLRISPAHPAPETLAARVEVESCVTLHSPRCWNPSSRLKTEREEGAGMGQITRTYAPDGALRMDALAEVRKLDPSLAEWSWGNVYTRPDLQLRALVVMDHDCDRRLAAMVHNPLERVRMCDAAYNGGFGGMQAERRACGQRAGCDPQRWFANVSEVCLKSKVRWKGYGRSACEINREHVVAVTVTRAPKYIPLMAAR
jgi:hypothetical protein